MIEEPPRLTIRRTFPRPTAAQIAAFRDVPTGFVCDAMKAQGADFKHSAAGRRARSDPPGGWSRLVAKRPAEILATMGALHVLERGISWCPPYEHRNCSASGDQFCGMLKNKGLLGS